MKNSWVLSVARFASHSIATIAVGMSVTQTSEAKTLGFAEFSAVIQCKRCETLAVGKDMLLSAVEAGR